MIPFSSQCMSLHLTVPASSDRERVTLNWPVEDRSRLASAACGYSDWIAGLPDCGSDVNQISLAVSNGCPSRLLASADSLEPDLRRASPNSHPRTGRYRSICPPCRAISFSFATNRRALCGLVPLQTAELRLPRNRSCRC